MPGGRGFGRGRGRGGGQRRMFFLQACLLVLLHKQPDYGYSLMDNLQEFGFQADQMDISVLYRILRELEENGLVTSTWDENSLGPQRRMYTISQQGESALTDWMAVLHQSRLEIEKLEAAYAAVKKSQ